MKTIIGFDSWTAGASNFERLVKPLKAKGYRLILIHIGSWGHDQGRPKEEYIGTLLVRDISFYSSKSLLDILRTERPSAVLFLSTRALAHMAVNRYATFLGIPTCHSYHGLVTVQAVGAGQVAYETNVWRQLSLIQERARKNVLRLIPTYARSLIATGAPSYLWYALFREILGKVVRGGLGTRFVPDTQTNIGCVYAAADVDHMHRNYHVSVEDIHVVGNPDLVSFGLKEDDFGTRAEGRSLGSDVLYIDTALVEAGVCFSSPADFVSHLKATHDTLADAGLHLVVKLHPAHFRTEVPEKLQQLGIEVCDRNHFLKRLKHARASMVEPSTAAMIPALIGLPLFLCQYGKLSGQRYGEVLTSYPRARFLKDVRHVPALLDEECKVLDSKAVRNWILKNSGPMPAEEMPERVSAAIDKLIRQCNSGIQ